MLFIRSRGLDAASPNQYHPSSSLRDTRAMVSIVCFLLETEKNMVGFYSKPFAVIYCAFMRLRGAFSVFKALTLTFDDVKARLLHFLSKDA
jgi:hypothetical protein